MIELICLRGSRLTMIVKFLIKRNIYEILNILKIHQHNNRQKKLWHNPHRHIADGIAIFVSRLYKYFQIHSHTRSYIYLPNVFHVICYRVEVNSLLSDTLHLSKAHNNTCPTPSLVPLSAPTHIHQTTPSSSTHYNGYTR